MEVDLVADTRCALGEGPIWHPDERRLYWVDIPAGHLLRYDPADGTYALFPIGSPLSGLTVEADGALLLFLAGGRVARWRDGLCSTLLPELLDEREGRFNDVIADPAGSVLAGTVPIGQRPGRLYRLDPAGPPVLLLDDVALPNGMGFTPDLRGLYLTETRAGRILLLPFDAATGVPGAPTIFAHVPGSLGRPDGLAVDAEGYIWSACWDGGCVVRYAPNGTATERVELPARKVTNLAFGGEHSRDLYVTTAGGDRREEEGAGAGALFRLRPRVGGGPMFRSRLSSPYASGLPDR